MTIVLSCWNFGKYYLRALKLYVVFFF